MFKDAKKNEVENTVSGKSYKDHNLSFEERIAALDESVKKGDVIVKSERAAGMIEGEFRTKEGELVATSYGAQINDVNGLEKWPVQYNGFAVFEMTFLSNNKPTYTIMQNSIPVTLETKEGFCREDVYSAYPKEHETENGWDFPGFHHAQTKVYDQAGKVVEEINYNQYGRISSQTSPMTTPDYIAQQGR